MAQPRRGGRESSASPQLHVLPPLRGSGGIGHLLPAAQAAGNLLSPPWGWVIRAKEGLATGIRLTSRHSRRAAALRKAVARLEARRGRERGRLRTGRLLPRPFAEGQVPCGMRQPFGGAASWRAARRLSLP
jgi:hypothetical protein